MPLRAYDVKRATFKVLNAHDNNVVPLYGAKGQMRSKTVEGEAERMRIEQKGYFKSEWSKKKRRENEGTRAKVKNK